MDDQALLEGIVVFSDEDGPGKQKEGLPSVRVCSIAFLSNLHQTSNQLIKPECSQIFNLLQV